MPFWKDSFYISHLILNLNFSLLNTLQYMKSIKIGLIVGAIVIAFGIGYFISESKEAKPYNESIESNANSSHALETLEIDTYKVEVQAQKMTLFQLN